MVIGSYPLQQFTRVGLQRFDCIHLSTWLGTKLEGSVDSVPRDVTLPSLDSLCSNQSACVRTSECPNQSAYVRTNQLVSEPVSLRPNHAVRCATCFLFGAICLATASARCARIMHHGTRLCETKFLLASKICNYLKLSQIISNSHPKPCLKLSQIISEPRRALRGGYGERSQVQRAAKLLPADKGRCRETVYTSWAEGFGYANAILDGILPKVDESLLQKPNPLFVTWHVFCVTCFVQMSNGHV